MDQITSQRGGARRGAGRPKGSKSPTSSTRALIAQITARMAAAPGRDVEVVLADIQNDAALPVPVRLASLRWLQDSLMGRLASAVPSEARAGEQRRTAGRPKGHRGTTAINLALAKHVGAVLAAEPGRDLSAALSTIVNDRAVALDVRCAALRRLAGAMMGQVAVAIEAEGRRLR